MKSLAATILRKLREQVHLRNCRAVLDTPPIVPQGDGVVLFSMIGTRVLLPYLVAVKSLASQLGMGRIVILDDGTLTRADKAVLAHHCGQPQIIPISAIETGACPAGGCWERLLAILDLRAAAYVIQLDSDTVTIGPVPEIVEAVKAGRSFTLRGDAIAQLGTLPEIAEQQRAGQAAGAPGSAEPEHVQAAIECRLDQMHITLRDTPRYVRGCAGFTGFARSGEGRVLAEQFAAQAVRLLGAARWSQWGSEQVASNAVIANEADPLLLDYDRYLNFWNQPVPAGAAFLHFIGTWRFHRGAYGDATRRAILALKI